MGVLTILLILGFLLSAQFVIACDVNLCSSLNQVRYFQADMYLFYYCKNILFTFIILLYYYCLNLILLPVRYDR